MKKNIFALIALAVAFVGCSKEASETPSPAAEGQKFVIKITLVSPEVIIRVNTYNRIEKFLFKRQIGGIGFNGNNLFPTQPHSIKEFPIFLRVTPQI